MPMEGKNKSSIKKSMLALKESLAKSEASALVPVKPVELREVLPTMSKTDLLLTCPWPWGRRVPPEKVGPPAKLGSGVHKALEQSLVGFFSTGKAAKIDFKKIAKNFGCEPAELKMRFESAWGIIPKWLKQDNPWGIDFSKGAKRIETSVAYDVELGTARWIEAPTVRDHVYEDRKPNELPGTVDLAIVCDGYLLVLDWKTGEEIPEVTSSGQLLSLALAIYKLCEAHAWSSAKPLQTVKKIIIGFGHTPWTGITTVYADSIEIGQLDEHARKLKEAFRRRGGEWLHPNKGCPICPAFPVCPTQIPTLEVLRDGRRALTTPEEVGGAHYHLQMYRKQFAKLDEIISEEIRGAVAEWGPCPRPDGRTVDLVKRPFTNLSMSAIKRQLGEVEGKKLIDQLEKMGAIEHGERYELRSTDD